MCFSVSQYSERWVVTHDTMHCITVSNNALSSNNRIDT